MALLLALIALCLVLPTKAELTLSPGVVCRRWSHAAALYDGVVYMYGGSVWVNESDAGQRNNTVTQDFITLDLTNDFNVDAPPFGGLTIPQGPPKVANGSFWVDDAQAALYFYGGAYENFPPDPDMSPLKVWAYHPKTSLWSPVDTIGDNVTRATQGASAYYNGVGYYRGGHIDQYTVEDWGANTSRVYLGGMLEFTFSNKSFYNDTTGFDVYGQAIAAGYQDGNLIPIELNGRAYLIDFAGGGRTGTALPLNNAYIYDIAKQKWFEQPISQGPPTNTRGACTATNYAPDNSSINIHVYGGKVWDGEAQIFVPSDNMWVLTIPSFIWISIPLDGAVGSPGARQDHTCHMMGSNMLVIGGRNTSNVCDNSTVYVFDTSDLTWQTSYQANKTVYTVPTTISAVIGGNANGSAPWTNVPAIKPSDKSSPFYAFNKSSDNKSSHVGAIVGGVVGGVLLLIGLIATFFLLRRHKTRKEAPVLPSGHEEYYQPPLSNPREKNTWSSMNPNDMPPSPPLSEAPRYSSIHGVSSYGMASPLSQLDGGDYQFPVEIEAGPPSSPGPMKHIIPSSVAELSGESHHDGATKAINTLT